MSDGPTYLVAIKYRPHWATEKTGSYYRGSISMEPTISAAVRELMHELNMGDKIEEVRIIPWSSLRLVAKPSLEP